MESLTKGLTWRKPGLKPLQITTITNHDGTTDDYMITATGEEQPLSPAARLFHQPNFNVYIIAIIGFKNPINPRVVHDKLPQTLIKHPRFSSVQVVDDRNGGIMKWVPTTVNLNNHIIIPNIPQTLDSPNKFLEDYVYNLSKTFIDSSKPMWDLHLLNLKTSEAEAIAIFRIHHSIGDGTSLMSLLLACTRQIDNPELVPTVPRKKDSKTGWFSSLRYAHGGPWWKRCFMVVCMVFWLVCNTLLDVGNVMATAFFLKDTETPIKAPAGVNLTPKRFAYRIVSLDDMKLIKNAMNTTINDVAIGVTQAGLSQYLNRRYGESNKKLPSPPYSRSVGLRGPEGKNDEGTTEKKNNLPKKNIRTRSTIVVNIRPSSGIQELADMMGKNSEAKWGNCFGYVILPITIGIRDDPLDYVRQAKATIDRKKRSLEALVTTSAATLAFKLLGVKAANSITDMAFTHTTFTFSNMVGPQEEIGFYGHDIEFIAPTGYGHPHGLMIHFQSYVNKMTIVLSVDENSFPDPEKLLDDLESSLKLIKEAVYAKGRTC